MKKAIIFDLDGTLADSSGCIVNAAHHVQKHLGLRPITDATVRGKIGQRLDFMLATLFNIEGQLLQQAIHQYSAAYVRIAATEERLFEGVTDMLERLKDTGFQLAIATGKSQNGANHSTARLGLRNHFDSIHGILPGTPGKPHPAVLLRAIEALGQNPDNCVMVGDTTFDLDLSNAAGVKSVGVTWGVHPTSKLLACKPAFVAKTIEELEQWLLSVHK